MEQMTLVSVLGQGVFGTVWLAKRRNSVKNSDEYVAVKRIRVSKKDKYQEIEILKLIFHPNCTKLLDYFYSYNNLDKGYLNIVLNYEGAQTLESLIKSSNKNEMLSCDLINKIFFQLLRALKYLHENRICHRDIKPSNIIVNPKNHTTKIIDFGHAKLIPKCEDQNLDFAMTCYRNYRAPELLMGNVRYDFSVDIWSLGCILAEVLFKKVIFPGVDLDDQMLQIMCVLGSPTLDDIKSMVPHATDFENLLSKKKIAKLQFEDLLPSSHKKYALALDNMIKYSPSKRWTSSQLLKSRIFFPVYGIK